MNRRRKGVAGIKAKQAKQDVLKAEGEKIQNEEFAHMEAQFEKFKERLEHFAKNHRAEIQKNPEFRRQFQSMCASIGVDPLASSRGFWADMLGVGDYYYELAVRVVEYCLANRNTLGGLIQMSVIAKYLGENPNDITIALKKLRKLGSGYQVFGKGSDQVVQVMPGEFTDDAIKTVECAIVTNGKIDVETLVSNLGWTSIRAETCLEGLLHNGTAWFDEIDNSYWFPALFNS